MTEPASRTRQHGADAASAALRRAGGRLLGALLQQAGHAATDRIAGLSERLIDFAERSGTRRGKRGDDRSVRNAAGSAVTGITGTVRGLLSRAGGDEDGSDRRADDRATGGRTTSKVTSLVESTDVRLPLRTTYDLWTRLEGFCGLTDDEGADQEPDESTGGEQLGAFWARRGWRTTVIEQVPDSHIVWRSEGSTGSVEGAVDFAELDPELTRVWLVLEYAPRGLLGRAGRFWGGQDRRARRGLERFRRRAMTTAWLHPEEAEGWRGEIRDGQVVTTHEEAIEQEELEESGPQDSDVEDKSDGGNWEERPPARETESTPGARPAVTG